MAEATNPYAPPKAALEDNKSALPALAGRRDRFAASFVDGILALIAGMMAALSGEVLFAVLALAGLGGWNLWTVHKYRASVGKRFIGLRIVRGDGTECTGLRIVFLRWLPVAITGALPLIGPVLVIADALFIFRHDRRCLHDRLADTAVVDA